MKEIVVIELKKMPNKKYCLSFHRFLAALLLYWPGAAFMKVLKIISVHQNGLTFQHFKPWLAVIDAVLYIGLFVVELNIFRILVSEEN